MILDLLDVPLNGQSPGHTLPGSREIYFEGKKPSITLFAEDPLYSCLWTQGIHEISPTRQTIQRCRNDDEEVEVARGSGNCGYLLGSAIEDGLGVDLEPNAAKVETLILEAH